MNIVDSKSFDLLIHLTSTQLPRQQIELIINKAPVTYILYKIPKKNGGTAILSAGDSNQDVTIHHHEYCICRV